MGLTSVHNINLSFASHRFHILEHTTNRIYKDTYISHICILTIICTNQHLIRDLVSCE